MKKSNYQKTSKIKIHILLILFSTIAVGSYGDEPVEKHLNSILLPSERAEVPISSKEPSKSTIAPVIGLLVPCTGCSEPYSQGTGECQDFDGDGVANKCDLDDDNDGVLDTVEDKGNGNCTSSGGVTISNLSFAPTTGNNTAVTATGTTLNVTGNSWHSDYTTTTVTAPFFFEFTADASTGNMMIGVIGATQAQPSGTNSFGGNSYKFHFQDGVYYNIRKFGSGQLNTDMYGGGDKFSIEINTSNQIIMKRNGFVVYTDNITTGDTQFRLAVSVGSGRTFSNVVWGGTNTITTNCQYSDADGDGVPNRYETDSDNDGCPDAFEAGVSTDQSFNQFGPSNVGANGFENSIETSSESGAYNGFYNYNSAINATIDACRDAEDSDGDGLSDAVDIDDDNDGILDTIESGTTSCGDGTVRTISWDWEGEKMTSQNWGYFADKPETRPQGGPGVTLGGAGGAWAVSGLDNNGTLADAVTKQEYQFAQFTTREKGIFVNSWIYYVIDYRNPAYYGNKPNMGILIDDDPNFNSPSVINDGTQPTQSYATVNTYENLVHLSNPIYLRPFTTYYVRFYDLKKSTVPESPFSISHDQLGLGFEDASGSNCGQELDTDNDGLPNRLDLDSDGDTCPDVYESRVPGATNGTGNYTDNLVVDPATPTAGVGANGYKNTLETSADSGSPSFTASYFYAIASSLNMCEDTDNDGKPDLVDMDDDNDGILDIIEQTCTNANITSKTGIIVSKPSTINYTFTATKTLASLVNGVDGTDYVIQSPTGTLNNSEWFRVEFPVPKTLVTWEVSHASGETLFATTSTYKVQGSNNGTTWSDLTGTLTYSRTQAGQTTKGSNSNVAQFANNKIPFKFYRYFGVSGVTASGRATEFFFVERTCTDLDTDSDGVPNRQDLDSDGDRCPDATEAGVISYIQGTGAVYSSGNVVNSDMSFNHPEAVAGPGTSNPAAYGTNGFYNSLESNDLSTSTYTNASGYTYGNAVNSAVADCICYEVPLTDGTVMIPLHGTTTLNRAGATMDPGQWLEPRKGAHLVLESKTKGFVITRIASPETAITAPVPGMTVYDTDDNCIKIYVNNTDGWQCFSIQTCND